MGGGLNTNPKPLLHGFGFSFLKETEYLGKVPRSVITYP